MATGRGETTGPDAADRVPPHARPPVASVFALSGLFVLGAPSFACAAGGLHVPPAAAGPFVLLLVAIAVLPLVAARWWHRNRNKALVVAVLGPAGRRLPAHRGEPGRAALVHELAEYFSFIVLLGALYVVAGGIVLRGDLVGRPRTNLLFLAAGAVLANLIGTTGASMVLIRPVLRINSQRKRTGHIPVFFIFAVGNTGGLLTPLGDPPLFLGFLKGVGFFWTTPPVAGVAPRQWPGAGRLLRLGLGRLPAGDAGRHPARGAGATTGCGSPG